MTKKNLVIYGVIALAFAAIGAYVANSKRPAPIPVTPLPPVAAPAAATPVEALYALELPDVAGKPQPLSQWKGKPMVVNFWATWCAPCVQEMPELSALQNEDIGKKVQIIGIGIDSPTNIAEFAAKLKIAYPIYVAGMSGTDLSRQLGNEKGGLPFTVLIGADGQVKKTYLGKLKFEQLRADLTTL